MIHIQKVDSVAQAPMYLKLPDCQTSLMSKEHFLLEGSKKQRNVKGQVQTPPYPWHRSKEQFVELSTRFGEPAPGSTPSFSAPATAAAEPAVPDVPETTVPAEATQQASQAGATTVQHFMQVAQVTGAPVRQQVVEEMHRATAYLQSLAAANLEQAEALMAAAQAVPTPADDPEDWTLPAAPPRQP
jgi:hypothetical protein